METLHINGKIYISSKRAAHLTGYAVDYVGQLCRGGKVECTRLGRVWYVTEDSVLAHKKLSEQLTEKRLEEVSRQAKSVSSKSPRTIGKTSKVSEGKETIKNTVSETPSKVPSKTPLIPSLKKLDVRAFVNQASEAVESATVVSFSSPVGSLPFFSNTISRVTLSSALIVSLLFGSLSLYDSAYADEFVVQTRNMMKTSSVAVIDTVKSLQQEISSVADTAKSSVANSLADSFTAVSEINENLEDGIDLLVDSTVSGVQGVVVAVSDTVNTAGDGIEAAVKNSTNKANTFVSNLVTKEIVAVNELIETVGNAIDSAVASVASLPSALFASVSSISISIPRIALPSLPDIEVPHFALPKIELPKLALGRVTLPQAPQFPEMPQMPTLPAFPKLSFSMPALPSLSEMPALPRVTLPKISAEDFALIDFGGVADIVAFMNGADAPKFAFALGRVTLPQIPEMPKLSFSMPQIPSVILNAPALALSGALFVVSSANDFIDSAFVAVDNTSRKIVASIGDAVYGGYKNASDFGGSITDTFATLFEDLSDNVASATDGFVSSKLAQLDSVSETVAIAVNTDSTSNNSFDVKSIAAHIQQSGKGLVSEMQASVASAFSNPFEKMAVTVYRVLSPYFEITKVNNLAQEGVKQATSTVSTRPSVTTGGTRVVERLTTDRVTERVVVGDISRVEVDQKLQDLANKITTDFYRLSTGSGGAVTNIYQTIAQSQRIDTLTNTTIQNPTVTGGSLSGISVSASTLSVTGTGTSTFAGGIDLGGIVNASTFLLNGSPFSTSQWTTTGSDIYYTLGNVGVGTTSPYAKLSVAGEVVGAYFTGTSTATSTFGGPIAVGGTGTSTFANGINLAGGCFAVNGTCFTGGSGGVGAGTQGQLGFYNAAGTDITATSSLFLSQAGNFGIGSTTPYAKLFVSGNGYFDGIVTTSSFTATSTTASVFPYASTTALTVSGTNGLTIGSLTGPLQAVNGLVSATSSIGPAFGGTGLTSLPSYGQVLVGNALGGYTLTATSSLGITSQWTTNGLNIYYNTGNIGLGTTTPWARLSVEGTSTLGNSATAGYFNATTTTATSTFAGPLVAKTLTIAATPGGSPLARFLESGAIDLTTTGVPGNTDVLSWGTGGTAYGGLDSQGRLRLNPGNYSNFTQAGIDSTLLVGGNSSGATKIVIIRGASGQSERLQEWQNNSGTALAYVAADGAASFANLTVGSLTGPLQAVNGLVSATSTLSTVFGGTGISTAPSYGQVLLGNASGGYTLTATSSLGLSSQWTTLLSNIYFSTGNVGIGTTTPWARLSVEGTSTLGNSATAGYFNATTTTATSTFAGGLNVGSGGLVYDFTTGVTSINNLELGNLTFDTDAGVVTWTDMAVTGASAVSTPHSYSAQIDGTSLLTVYSESDGSGSIQNYGVGVGSTTPWGKLSVTGTSGSTRPIFVVASSTGSSQLLVNYIGNVAIGTTTPYSRLSVWSGGVGTGQAFSVVNNASTTLLNILDSGNVGIGTTSPWARLSVEGTSTLGNSATAGYFNATTTTATSTFAGGLNVGGGALVYDFTSGAVSIPSLQLGEMVFEADSGLVTLFDMPITAAQAAGSTTAYYTRMNGNIITSVYTEADGSGGIQNSAFGVGSSTPWGRLSVVGSASSTRPIFAVASSTGASQFIVGYDGNVGVGTSSPYAKFSVAGQIVGSYFTATSTTASVFPYASTTALTVSGTNGLTLASLTGPLQAVNGLVSATSTLSTVFGGTGISTAPSYGQVLLGNASGGYTLTATSSLGLSSQWTTLLSNIYFSTGNVGIGTTSPWAALSVEGTSTLGNSATAGYFIATSTSATSTFAGGLSVGNGALQYDFTSGVTSIDNLELGNLSFDTDAGVVNWTDLSVTASSSAGVVQSYTARLDGNSLLSIYGESDGVGGVQNARVGIGTSTPYARLTVWATSTTENALAIVNNASTTLFNVTGIGRVGIGTTTPWAKLSVVGSTADGNAPLFLVSSSTPTSTTTAFIVNASGNTGIGTTTPYSRLSVWSGGVGTGQAFSVVNNASTTLLNILDSGNVGIGTTSPWARLSVEGTSTLGNSATAGYFNATTTTATSTFAGGLNVGGGALKYDFTTGVTSVDNLEFGALSFETNAGIVSWTDMPVTSGASIGTIQSYSAQIDGNQILTVYAESDGAGGIQNSKVGVGTTTPTEALSVGGLLYVGGAGTSTVQENLYVRGTLRSAFSYVGDLIFSNDFRFVEAPATATPQALFLKNQFGSTTFAIDEDGNVGLGTTSPAYKLHVFGDVAATSFVNTSTRELKTDIAYLSQTEEDDVLSKIKNTKIARYHYTSEDQENPLRIGLIAEEAPAEVLAPGGKGVDVYKLTTFLLAGVKSQQLKIESLENRIASIEQLIASGGTDSGSGSGVSLSAIGAYFEGLGTKISNGITEVRSLVANTISAKNITVKGTDVAKTGITIYDRVTGSPVCMFVANGVTSTEPGACEESVPVIDTNTSTTTDTGSDSGGETGGQTGGDVTAPVITVVGNNPAEVLKNASYIDLGATVFDAVSPNIGIQVEGDQIDTSVPGTYTVRYSATDGAGNVGTAERVVNVIETAPQPVPESESGTATTTTP